MSCCSIRNLNLFLLLFIFTAVVVLPSTDLLNELYSQGIALYSAGNFKGAVDYLEQTLRIYPTHTQARYYLIFCYINTNQKQQALKHAQVLADQLPHLPDYQQLATSLKNELYKPVIKTVSSSAISDKTKLTNSKNKKLDKKTAKKNIVTTPKINPDIKKIIEFIDDEKYKEATSVITRLLKKKPKNTKAIHYLGIIKFNQGNFKEAANNFEKAIKYGIKNFETHFMAASAYVSMNISDKAEQQFLQALKIKDDVFSKIHLADIYVENSRFGEAEKMFKNILKTNPDVIDAEVGLMQIKLEQGYLTEASAGLNKILGEHSDNAKARFVKAKIMLANKMYDEAVEEATVALQYNPLNIEYKAFCALVLIRNFSIQQGIDALQEILLEHPYNIYSLNAIAEGFFVAGNHKEAMKHLMIAEKQKKAPQTSFLMALIATSIDDKLKYYKEYLRRSKNNPTALIEYAKFIETVGTQKEALDTYNKIIKLHKATPFAAEAEAAIKSLRSYAPSSQPNYMPIPGF